MELRHRVLGLALLCAAGASHGLVLGPVSGAAWIGRPLDLVIPVQGAVGEDALSSCFEVEVYHGDSRQESSRVSVVARAGVQPHTTEVKIASISSVDEPVVTVQVRATCSQKVSRHYVLLADMPREIDVSAALRDAPTPEPQLARLDPAVTTPSEPATPTVPTQQSATAPVASPPVAAPPVAAKPTPVQASVRKRPAVKSAAAPRQTPSGPAREPGKPAAPKARLVLDSLEMLSDRVASLESATAEALKPDLSTDAQKVQTLEADVKALLALAAKNEASLTDLKARLQKAEAERLPNEVVYGLIALALAALVAWRLWNRRQRHAGSWSSVLARPELPESGPMPMPMPTSVASPAPAPSQVDDSGVSKAARLQALSAMLDRNGPPSEVDVSLIEMSESNFDNLMKSGTPQNAIRVPSPARAARPSEVAVPAAPVAPVAPSGLSADAVFDIRQQAEFFVSLGQTDRAIRVLEGQISATDVPNPLVYLDLLALLHIPSRKTDFRRVREDFNLLFNTNAPEFAQFNDEGRGLEAYPEVLSAIAALWPDLKVQAVIETCVLRDPWGSSSQPFDLAAFRDLLFLHALAQTMAALPSTKSEMARAVSPLAQVAAPAVDDLAQPDILLDDLGPSSELDVDLNDTHGAGPVTIPTAPS